MVIRKTFDATEDVLINPDGAVNIEILEKILNISSNDEYSNSDKIEFTICKRGEAHEYYNPVFETDIKTRTVGTLKKWYKINTGSPFIFNKVSYDHTSYAPSFKPILE